ncbi:MAG: helix-turn-helix domain-containing protein [Candidatus Shapirobacteria bacterium]|jgi:cytoskeletal protein RodZ
MLRASTILSHARLDKELDFVEVSKKLKIPQKYLQAIEEENKSLFPQEPYCSLIIKDYANFLNLNGEEILRIFRRDFNRESSSSPLRRQSLGITPNFIFKLSLLVLFLAFASYLYFEYLSYSRPPKLSVIWPENNLIIDNTANITGQTDSEATVSVNGEPILVDPDGKFSTELKIPQTGLDVTIESRSISGKTTITSKNYHF